jgi:hypothetical protein
VCGLFSLDTPEWIPNWRFLALMCPPLAILAAEGFRLLDDRLRSGARVPLTAVVGFGALVSVALWSTCGQWAAWLGGVPCRERMPRYPFEKMVSWIDRKTTATVAVTPGTYWQTPVNVYASFIGSDRITEYVPPYGSPAPPLKASELSEMCQSVPVHFVVVPGQHEAGGWHPIFMAPDQAGILAQSLGQGTENTVVFLNGRFRLEVLPCPRQ